MTICFHCHVCGREFAVSEELAGTQARCLTCATIVTIPRPLAPATELVPLPAAPPAEPSGIPPWVWMAAVGGGVAVLLLVGLLAFLPSSGDAGKPVAVSDRPAAASGLTPFGPASPLSPAPGSGAAPRTPPPSSPSSPAPEQRGLPFLPGRSAPPSPSGAAEDWPKPSRPWNAPAVPGATATNPPLNPPSPKSPEPPPPAKDSFPTESGGAAARGNTDLPKIPNLADGPRSRPGHRPGRDSPSTNWGGDRDGRASRSSELTPWQVPVDGPPQPIEYSKGKLSIPVPAGGRVVFPNRPSNFVLVSGRDAKRRESWLVYDLRTGKEIGKPVYPDQGTQPPLFSPDGRYAADRLQVSGKQAYGIWSFVSGEFVRELSLGDRGSATAGFGGPHQFMSITDGLEALEVRVWDVTTGEEARKLSIVTDRNRRPLREARALTPGGRYLSVVEGDRLSVYDLTNGVCVGQTPLPDTPSSCSAMVFSPDGTELAAMLTFTAVSRLLIWDFTTGAVLLDHEAGGSGPLHFLGGDLQWLPDKSALLYRGSVLLDHETGLEIWTFPEDRFHGRRMLSLKRMLAVLDGRGGRALTYVDLPERDLQKAVETVRGGGQAVDSVLPKLVRANTLSAQAKTLPNGFVTWSVAPDPAGSPETGRGRELLVANEDETLTAALFAGPAAGKIAVHKTAYRATGSGRGREQAAFIQRYDLKSGQKGKDVPLPQVYRMLDVSPSGDYVLVGFNQRGSGWDRLDVIRFAPLEHIAGWRPYEGEKQAASRGRDDGTLVARAMMLDDTHVLTVNGAGKLVLWQLPDCHAVYSFADFGTPVAISPQRKYMVGVHRQELRVFETASGECRGDLKMPVTGTQLRRAAFRADGGALAAVVGGGKDYALAIWNLATGELATEFPLPSAVLPWSGHDGGALEWRGTRHLMLDQRYLIDVKNRAVVWSYHLPHGSIFAGRGPDERTWFCAPRGDSIGQGPRFLVSTETPSTGAKLKTEFVTLEKQLVLGPGTSVRLDVMLSGEMKPKVEQVLTEALQARGIQLQPNAPLQFLLTTRQGTTGDQLGVSDSQFGFGRPTMVFAQEEITCEMAIKDAAGKELWSYQRKVNMRSHGTVKKDQAQAELSQEMRANFEQMMTSGDFIREGLPAYIFGDLDRILAGSSTLTFRGEGPPPPAPKAAR